MKQSELKNCHICGKGLMHDHQIYFYKVKVEQFVFDLSAIQRQHGLEMSMGASAALAQIMGPDNDLAQGTGEVEVLICAEHLLKVAEFIPENENG